MEAKEERREMSRSGGPASQGDPVGLEKRMDPGESAVGDAVEREEEEEDQDEEGS